MSFPYPPCLSSRGPCSSQKSEWSGLVGMDVQQAKAIINRDNPFVTVVPVSKDVKVTHDFCCNRVWLVYDEKNRVVVTPRVG